MDPIFALIGAVAVLGVLWFLFMKDDKDSTDNAAITTPKPAPAPAPVSERVAALKSDEAVKSTAAPVAKKLPTKTALLKLTKAKIEETAREFDVELDKRMTKENMVSTFLKEARAAAKAQLK